MDVEPVKPVSPAAENSGLPPPPGSPPLPGSPTPEKIVPERIFTLDRLDLALRKKPPPTHKTGKPIRLDNYDDDLGKADPNQEVERFKADVARQTDVRQEDLDVYLEEDRLWYRIRSQGIAGEIHFQDPADRQRIEGYVSASYSKMLTQLGQKEWTYTVGGGVTPRYNVGEDKVTVGTSQNFGITKLFEHGQQISLRGVIEENGLDNTTVKLMVDASDPFWGRFKDLNLTIKRNGNDYDFKFDTPHIKLGDELEDGLRDRGLDLLKKAFLQGDPVALAEIGAAVGLVVGAGALIYSGTLDNTFVGEQTKKGINIPIGLDMNIFKTGRQRLKIKGTPTITIGSHKLEVGMKEAGLGYELNHQLFLFKADGVYKFEDETVKVKGSLEFWGNRGSINVEHVNGLGDSSKTSTSFGGGIGGPINGHWTWHADYRGTVNGEGKYAGSSVGGRLTYNKGGFQTGWTANIGAGVDGLGVSKDAISPYVTANVQYRF